MARLAWSALAMALALACGAAAAQEADADASAAAGAVSAPLEDRRWSFGPQADSTATFTAFVPRDLARGTLLRARINDDASLMLRLRGSRIGIYFSLRLND
jgi:hypothetical protein